MGSNLGYPELGILREDGRCRRVAGYILGFRQYFGLDSAPTAPRQSCPGGLQWTWTILSGQGTAAVRRQLMLGRDT